MGWGASFRTRRRPPPAHPSLSPDPITSATEIVRPSRVFRIRAHGIPHHTNQSLSQSAPSPSKDTIDRHKGRSRNARTTPGGRLSVLAMHMRSREHLYATGAGMRLRGNNPSPYAPLCPCALLPRVSAAHTDLFGGRDSTANATAAETHAPHRIARTIMPRSTTSTEATRPSPQGRQPPPATIRHH